MNILFKKTNELESEIENYLDLVVKGGFLFKQSLKFFFENSTEDFKSRLDDINHTEHRADILRREIETKLYLNTLIPESRGDVLGLIEACDKVLNRAAETLNEFHVENPFILEEIKPYLFDLTDLAINTINEMVAAVRAYFTDITKVRDYVNRVQLFETEADKLGEKIKKMIFSTDIKLSQKMHMRFFVNHIDNIADDAEDVCDRLSIAVIKRMI